MFHLLPGLALRSRFTPAQIATGQPLQILDEEIAPQGPAGFLLAPDWPVDLRGIHMARILRPVVDSLEHGCEGNELIVLPFKMSVNTRPGPLPDSRAKIRPDRIDLHVAKTGVQVRVIHR